MSEFCRQAIHLISYRKVIDCTFYIADSMWWRYNIMMHAIKKWRTIQAWFRTLIFAVFSVRCSTHYLPFRYILNRSLCGCHLIAVSPVLSCLRIAEWLIDWLIRVLKDKWLFSSSLYVMSHGPIYLASHANLVMARPTAASHNSITKFETIMIRKSISFVLTQTLSNVNTMLILTPKHVSDCTV